MWARIDGGVAVEFTGIDPSGRFTADLIWVPCPPGIVAGSTFDGSAFHAPPPPAAPVQSVPALASAALAESDITVIRCYEHAVAVPAEWVAYRAALRAIVAGGTGAMPTRPAFPAGT